MRDAYHISPPLRLAKVDWGQSFYMPPAQGVVPFEGNVKVAVDCHTSVS